MEKFYNGEKMTKPLNNEKMFNVGLYSGMCLMLYIFVFIIGLGLIPQTISLTLKIIWAILYGVLGIYVWIEIAPLIVEVLTKLESE